MKKCRMLVIMAVLTFAFTVMAQTTLKMTSQKDLRITGQTNVYYRIETSPNLTSWAPQGSYFLLSNTPFTKAVSETGNSREFFRAGMLPLNWTTMNNSIPDTCAEHDNVSIVFKGNVTNFSITATHPVNYTVTSYDCAANFNGCVPDNGTNYYFNDPHLWSLKHGIGQYGAWANITRKSSFWRPKGMDFAYTEVFPPETNIHQVDFGREIVAHGGESPGYFVLYSDGYVRLIPFPPVGQGSVCFGSSVIIGPAPVSDRPYADIESVMFRYAIQTLLVTYRGGGKATIDFSDVNRTRLIVKITTTDFPINQPFCTFRSMYVSDGNSDCDRVVWQNINGVKITNSIMSFSGTTGTNWFFNRQVRSSQRQSAPDIRITIP